MDVGRDVRSLITHLEPSLKGKKLNRTQETEVLKKHGLYDSVPVGELARMGREARIKKGGT